MVLDRKGTMVLYIVTLKVSYIRISIEPVFFYNDIKVDMFKRVGSLCGYSTRYLLGYLSKNIWFIK
jgi:hypothetical protein